MICDRMSSDSLRRFTSWSPGPITMLPYMGMGFCWCDWITEFEIGSLSWIIQVGSMSSSESYKREEEQRSEWGGAMSQRAWTTSRSWTTKRNRFSPTTSRGNTAGPTDTLILGHGAWFGLLASRTINKMYLCHLKATKFVEFCYSSSRELTHQL